MLRGQEQSLWSIYKMSKEIGEEKEKKKREMENKNKISAQG